jgi:hypothetical protein
VDFGAQLAAIDRATLTSPVRKILQKEMAEVVEWRYQPIVGGMGEVWGSNNVCRFVGSAHDSGHVLGWSLVLKVVPIPTPRDGDGSGIHDPASEDYWKREVLTYESGILDNLPSGLSAPRCFGVVEHDGFLGIWLEDLVDTIGPRWSLPRFGVAARHLGRFNGAYLTGRPLSSYPWLNRNLLRGRADANTAFWARLDRLHSDPLFRIGWPGDVASLVVQSVIWGKGVGAADLPELDRLCTEEYLEGLRDAGWRGDPRLARLGCVATMALHYGPLHGLASVVGIDADRRARLEHTFGQPIEEVLDRYAGIQRYVYQRFDEAHELLALL